MLETKSLIERRKHRRFKVKDESFYILNPNSTELGEIIDISLSGLAFYHVKKQHWSTDIYELGVLFGDNDTIIDDLPLKSVSERAMAPGLPDNASTIWRRSVEFGDLTSEQTAQLENFILLHTTEEA
jgi:hypothetical protein